jgi:hypothetical protein
MGMHGKSFVLSQNGNALLHFCSHLRDVLLQERSILYQQIATDVNTFQVTLVQTNTSEA